MILARLAASDPEKWSALAEALASFGAACGLFRGVEVHRAKKEKVSEPFQIMVDIEGQRAPANLVDVGYGVSQVLPVLVDAFLQPSGWFLLQQPEVHLHPRAQAELGSFLGAMVANGRRFTVETHSDYLLDRVCIEVREGKHLKPEDVMVLFFERTGPHVTIHEIEIDSEGNIQGAPPTYRQFFQREQGRFLGLSE
jgi:predicted ATPase